MMKSLYLSIFLTLEIGILFLSHGYSRNTTLSTNEKLIPIILLDNDTIEKLEGILNDQRTLLRQGHITQSTYCQYVRLFVLEIRLQKGSYLETVEAIRSTQTRDDLDRCNCSKNLIDKLLKNLLEKKTLDSTTNPTIKITTVTGTDLEFAYVDSGSTYILPKPLWSDYSFFYAENKLPLY